MTARAHIHEAFSERLPSEVEIENADQLRMIMAGIIKEDENTVIDVVQGRGGAALAIAAIASFTAGTISIVFLSALINGLQSSLIESTLGSQPHITLRVPREEPRALVTSREGLAVARLRQPAPQRLRSLDQWSAVMDAALRTPGVTAHWPKPMRSCAKSATARDSLLRLSWLPGAPPPRAARSCPGWPWN